MCQESWVIKGGGGVWGGPDELHTLQVHLLIFCRQAISYPTQVTEPQAKLAIEAKKQ